MLTRLVLFAPALLLSACAPGFMGNSEIDPALYPEPPENAITFWGHATSYIDIDGYGIVTDPVFEKSYSPFHSRKIPAPPPAAYDQTDVILISHAHRDHLHPDTLKRFPRRVLVLCPEPAAEHVREAGLEVQVMQPGDGFTFPGGTIAAVPAHHPGGRNSMSADADGRALGYVVHARGRSIYYSGDTEYFHGMYSIRTRHHPDIAIMNINSHLNAYDAMFAIAALGNPAVILSHYGAYNGTNASRTPGWQEELQDLVGPILVRLEVGKSYPIEERRDRVKPLTPVP